MAELVAPGGGGVSLFRVASILALCVSYIIVSGGLINFNKYLMHEDRFPHPLPLTVIHMLMSSLLSLAFFQIRPSAFAGVLRARGKGWELSKRLVPIALCFAVMLYGSNKAYLYCSVAFLQFMKEANVVMVFLISVLVGLQHMNRQRALLIVWIIMGSSLCVSGELHFSLAGFLFQAASQASECARAVMAQLVLTGEEYRLDPFSYTLLVSPLCLVILLLGTPMAWEASVATDLRHMYHLVLPNACLAFILNLIIALVIKETSAVGFIVTGIVKDIVLVVFSSVVFDDVISVRQWLAFSITLSGVFFWSFMTAAPNHPIVTSYGKCLCSEEPLKATDESTALAPEATPASSAACEKNV